MRLLADLVHLRIQCHPARHSNVHLPWSPGCTAGGTCPVDGVCFTDLTLSSGRQLVCVRVGVYQLQTNTLHAMSGVYEGRR